MDTSIKSSSGLREPVAQISILIVDDSDDDIMLFHEAFERIDPLIQCAVASDGREALEKLEEMEKAGKLPKLILMDLNMPIMDGCTAVRKIRKRLSLLELTVVIFTSSELLEDAQNAYAAGANACVRKPDTYADWVNALRSLVAFFARR